MRIDKNNIECHLTCKHFRFSSLDKQDKGYLSREDFLRIPELAINPLGDRIVHAFFFESRSQEEEKVDFKDFVRVLAHFRPIKKNAEKNKLNTRMEKLHFAFRFGNKIYWSHSSEHDIS